MRATQAWEGERELYGFFPGTGLPYRTPRLILGVSRTRGGLSRSTYLRPLRCRTKPLPGGNPLVPYALAARLFSSKAAVRRRLAGTITGLANPSTSTIAK